MDKYAIEIKNLTKVYDNKYHALRGINLSIKKNTIFGLLGPNGAGKSSLINILSGMSAKTSGSIKVLGSDFDKDPIKIKYLLGIVPQEIFLDTFFNVEDTLELYAGYFGIRPNERKTSQIMQAMHLTSKAKSTPAMLSGGMKRRLMVAKAMVHSPKILILDEPTAGVDIELRQQLWDYVLQLKDQGTTIILTTHYLAEAEKLCDEIAFIDKGQIIHSDKKHNLLNTLGSKRIIIQCQEIDNVKLQQYPEIRAEGSKLIINFSINDDVNQLLSNILSLGVVIKNIQIEQDDLESVYKHYIKY
jgi:ABC-2 type transport system ATP-binding protein